MATFWRKYYYYIGGNSVGNHIVPRMQERIIDFAVQNVATTDTQVNMIPVPNNTLVMTAGYQTITTVTSASATFVIGDTTKGASYCSSAAAVAAGAYGARPTIAATSTNVLYGADDDICIKTIATANLTVGQIRVFAVMMFPEMIPSYKDADGNTKTYVYTDRNAWVTTAPVIP